MSRSPEAEEWSGRTLLVGLAHPDDEVGAAGTILAQRAKGDRVVIVWLTRGEQTEAFGPIQIEEVARRREVHGHRAGEILGAETIFMNFRDTELQADRATTLEVARLISSISPDGLITWGDGWVRGTRHPDHQACGEIFRNAITLARIAKLTAPEPPHRKPMPVFTLRDIHSRLPTVGVDVTQHREKIAELADHYLKGVGFGDPGWLEQRLLEVGSRYGFRYGEEFDAWETLPGAVTALLPASPLPGVPHPDRREEHLRQTRGDETHPPAQA